MVFKYLKVEMVLNGTFLVIFEANVGTEGGIRYSLAHVLSLQPAFKHHFLR